MTVVYFIESGESGPIKIGIARQAQQRLMELQVGNPHELRIVAVVKGDREMEATLHRRFASERMRGEWFRGDGEVRAFAEEIAAGTDFDAEYAIARESVVCLGPKSTKLGQEPKRKRYTPEEWHRLFHAYPVITQGATK